MERRVTSHTEEEEMNQRRRLLTLARKGDQKAVELLFELYQVKVFSGDALKKKKLPTFPTPAPAANSVKGQGKSGKKLERTQKSPSANGSSKDTAAVLQREPKTKIRRPSPSGPPSKSIKPKNGKVKSRASAIQKKTLKTEGKRKTASSAKSKHKTPSVPLKSAKAKKK